MGFGVEGDWSAATVSGVPSERDKRTSFPPQRMASVVASANVGLPCDSTLAWGGVGACETTQGDRTLTSNVS